MKRDRENLKNLIRKLGFEAVEEILLQNAYPSIRVETEAVENEESIAIGQSKIGGRPDLPIDMDWLTVPVNYGIASVPFIAQFDLEEASQYDGDSVLPKSGMLYFFGDYRLGKVIYYSGDKSKLERKEFPEDLPPSPPHEIPDHRFEPCSVQLIPEVNLSFDIPELKYPDGKDWEDFYELVYASSYSRNPPFAWVVNRLLGFPHDVPRDMQLDCQLEEDTGTFLYATQEQREIAEGKKSQWQLLFQMSSDDNANMVWSDNGTICFYIKEHDLKSQNFHDICLAFYTS